MVAGMHRAPEWMADRIDRFTWLSYNRSSRLSSRAREDSNPSAMRDETSRHRTAGGGRCGRIRFGAACLRSMPTIYVDADFVLASRLIDGTGVRTASCASM